MAFSKSNVNFQFQQPNVPGLVRQAPDISGGLETLFNQYMQMKQGERVDAQIQNAEKDRVGTSLLTGGVDPRQVTPQVYNRAEQPRMPGEVESPVIAAIRAHIEKKKGSEVLKAKTAQADFDKTISETEENRAQAAALGRDQIYVDPASGKQITVPRGAKLLPPGGGSDGKMLPAPTVLNVSEGQDVARILPDVRAAIDENSAMFGPVSGRISGINPYDTKAQTVDARLRTASQAFGRFMEGGVLRKEDEEKYRKMFPQLSDTPDLAKNKLSIVERQLAQKSAGQTQSLSDSGYNTRGVPAPSVPKSMFGGGPAVGTIKEGYRFKGGNPADKNSWEKQ